jgi:hypothetical protein
MGISGLLKNTENANNQSVHTLIVCKNQAFCFNNLQSFRKELVFSIAGLPASIPQITAHSALFRSFMDNKGYHW